MSPFSSGFGHFSVHLQAFQVTGSPLEMCVGFFHSQNLWGGGLRRSFVLICNSTNPWFGLTPKLCASQSSHPFMNGIIHGAHIPSYVFWHAKCAWKSWSPMSTTAEYPQPFSWCGVISGSFLSSHLPIPLKYLYFFLSGLFPTKDHQNPLLKVKPLGDGKGKGKRGCCPEQGTESSFNVHASSP